MWKCPKCSRTFRKENQSHFCGKAPATVDEYILAQEEEHREPLNRIRAVLKEALPEAEEKISWSMPTYWKDHNIIHFAANQKHIGLYPGPEAVKQFAEQLTQAGYPFSKGSIRIPYAKPFQPALIKDIAVWCRDTGNHA